MVVSGPRWTVSTVTIAQLKCQQVQLRAQSNYSGQRFRRVIGKGEESGAGEIHGKIRSLRD